MLSAADNERSMAEATLELKAPDCALAWEKSVALEVAWENTLAEELALEKASAAASAEEPRSDWALAEENPAAKDQARLPLLDMLLALEP